MTLTWSSLGARAAVVRRSPGSWPGSVLTPVRRRSLAGLLAVAGADRRGGLDGGAVGRDARDAGTLVGLADRGRAHRVLRRGRRPWPRRPSAPARRSDNAACCARPCRSRRRPRAGRRRAPADRRGRAGAQRAAADRRGAGRDPRARAGAGDRRGASWWRGSATTCARRWPGCERWPRRSRTAWSTTRSCTTSRSARPWSGSTRWSRTCSTCRASRPGGIVARHRAASPSTISCPTAWRRSSRWPPRRACS